MATKLVAYLCHLNDIVMKSPGLSLSLASQKEGLPLAFEPKGQGECGAVFTITDVDGKLGKDENGSNLSVAVKTCIHPGGGSINVNEYEIWMGKVLAAIAKGTTPHITQVYGGMTTRWVVEGGYQEEKVRVMLMEHIVPPVVSIRSFQDLLGDLEENETTWSEDFVRQILFQVIYTLAVIGPRFRHNDVKPDNILFQRFSKPTSFAYKVGNVYYKTKPMSFMAKLSDFGISIDTASSKKGAPSQKKLGIVDKPSSYFDLYVFLQTTLAAAMPSSLNESSQSANPQVAAFASFMERLKVKDVPTISKATLSKVIPAYRGLIIPWISSHIQKVAEKTGTDPSTGFIFRTPIQVLEDPYFADMRITEAEFNSFSPRLKFIMPSTIKEDFTNEVLNACGFENIGETMGVPEGAGEGLHYLSFPTNLSKPLSFSLQ